VAAFADLQLQNMGIERRVEIVVASFASAPWFLQRTSRLAVLHERLARPLLEQFDLASAPMPFDFPSMREMMQHHESRTNDEGLAWLRSQIFEAASVNL
jgi:hypothetical protein